MPADDRARSRRRAFRRAHHEHDRGGERHHHQGLPRRLGEAQHQRDADRAAGGVRGNAKMPRLH
jgi:hypothetical protein